MADHPNLTVLDHPLVQHKLTLLRDRRTSTGEFRRLAREISLLMGYELTRDLKLTTVRIETPLEAMDAPRQAPVTPPAPPAGRRSATPSPQPASTG